MNIFFTDTSTVYNISPNITLHNSQSKEFINKNKLYVLKNSFLSTNKNQTDIEQLEEKKLWTDYFEENLHTYTIEHTFETEAQYTIELQN